MTSSLAKKIKRCRVCEDHLPLEPRPIFQFSERSKIIIIGQAPGKVTHEAGIPWDDKSGERLRDWLGVTPKQFYDPTNFALVPMGFCYPGKGKSGDLPPRPECAEKWMKPIRNYLENIELEIYIGKYACDYHFENYGNLTELIKDQSKAKDKRIVLPHPSPRNNIWLKKNEWFTKTTIKSLQKQIRKYLE